ncbi:MAG TPA: acetoacetate decarboxylase family protein [Mycobacteriales bacterium]|nr:acetoacetate decarboxylase family protein [Mycobacteriales bacterium]HWA67999.1 acetoacetate decarboxylase family protein [Mycobacteriales bacterium]
MARVRYGARSLDELRNREVEATKVDTWATTLVATYETDPDAIAAVLPPPLSPPAEPLVRLTIATVDLGRGYPVFGAGTFAVHARHDDVDGDYALVMPMTTEQAVVGGRETFGEPKKLAEIGLDRNGDDIRGHFTRMGTTFVEVTGRVTGEVEPSPERTRTSFYLKFLPSPTGKGFDGDPMLVYCRRAEKTKAMWNVDGEVVLRESRFDPVADLPVRKLRSIELAERSSVQTGEVVSTIPADWVAPYVHQRYDDLSPVGSD